MTQRDALNILKMGHSVFLTGGAGSGKTYVLNAYIQYLKEHGIDVAITASTGIAATHIGGMTIHAWSGLGIKQELSPYELEQLEEKEYLWKRYQKVRVLIIDEISMLSGTFLSTLDQVFRSFKRIPDKPFGGIQVVLCGDLFQLPPVENSKTPPAYGHLPFAGEELTLEERLEKETIKTSSVSSVITHSHAWKALNPVVCYLTEQHRQDDDIFTEILNAMRSQSLEQDHHNHITSRITDFDEQGFMHMTKLMTHNVHVDTINDQALGQLSGEVHSYTMETKGKDRLIETLKKSCLAPELLTLKQDAQIMFVKNNFESGYVNGTRGIVIDFDDDDFPIVQTKDGKEITVRPETWSIEENGKVLASISQIPLRHAWAITIHKSQGMSLDEAVIDLSKSFTYGMGYVALSRVRRLSGLHLIGFSPEALELDPAVAHVDKDLRKRSELAQERIAKLDAQDLRQRHDDFIVTSGGSLEKKKVAQEKIITQKTHKISYDMLADGMTLHQVAKERDLSLGTIIEHLDKARQLGWNINLAHIKPKRGDIKIIRDAFEAVKQPDESIYDAKLTPVKKYLDQSGHEYSFDDIKWVRVFL